jgi:hypothetical protein
MLGVVGVEVLEARHERIDLPRRLCGELEDAGQERAGAIEREHADTTAGHNPRIIISGSSRVCAPAGLRLPRDRAAPGRRQRC